MSKRAARCLLLLLALVLAPTVAPTVSAVPGVSLPTAAAQPPASGVPDPDNSRTWSPYVDRPIFRHLFEVRQSASGWDHRTPYTSWSEYRNAAVAYVDASSRPRLAPYTNHGIDAWVVSRADLAAAEPDTVRQLKLGPRVTHLLVVRSLNVPNGGHSEALIKKFVTDRGLAWSGLELLVSERQPCQQCAGLLAGTRAAAKQNVIGLVPYRTPDEQSWSAGRLGKILAWVKQRLDAGPDGGRDRRARRTMSPDPATPTSGSVRQVSGPGGPSKTGGVDFRTLELRHLAIDPRSPGSLRYGFQTGGAAARADGRSATALRAAAQASDAFFVWLALDPSQFWVNLNPREPKRLVGPDLGRTDAGRVLLEADLAMKKSAAAVTRIGTPTGDRYWRLLREHDASKCAMRLWITPAPATVYATDTELYVIKSPLRVQMAEVAARRKCRGAAYSNRLYRELILPKVVRAVNTDAEYVELRRVYASRVAAEWCRAHCASDGPYGRLIDSGRIDAWRLGGSWRPQQVFRRYLRSYYGHEWERTYRERRGRTVWTYRYADGGVDFSRVPLRSISRAEFVRQHPTTARDVVVAVHQPQLDRRTGGVWIGGEVLAPQPVPAVPPPARGPATLRRWLTSPPMIVAAALTGLVGLAGALLIRRINRAP